MKSEFLYSYIEWFAPVYPFLILAEKKVNKRLDDYYTDTLATLLSINLISTFCTQFQLSLTVWNNLTRFQPMSVLKVLQLYY